jgi:hypothetical protein
MSDSATNLDTIATGQSQKEVTANAADDAESPASFGGRRASTTTGTTWGYYGGKYVAGGASPAITMLANGTVALTVSNTNYVEFDPVAGTVSANTTAFTAGRVPLYTVVVGSSTITSYTDQRCWGAPFNPRVTVNVAGSSNVTLTRAQANAQIIECTGVLTGNIQVIVPLNPDEWTFYNNTTGAFTLTVIGATGTGIAVTQGQRAILYADGTNVVQVISAAGGSGFANPMTTAGDIIDGGSAGVAQRLGIGSTNQVLTVVAGAPAWAAAAGFANPMTTAGDLIDGGSSGTPQRLGIGSTAQVLTVVSGAPAWSSPGAAMNVNVQTGTTYTLVLGDAPQASNYQGVVTMNNAAANTLTVPQNSSVAFPIGTMIAVIQLGAGQTTIAAGSGATVNSPSALTARAQYSTLILSKVATNTWILGGDMT